jgi:transposase
MLSIPSNATIYMAVEPVDMRKSFDGLTGLVTAVFQQNVFDGHLFLFVNRRRDRLKILWWDQDGLAIWMKRLERGTYETPPHDQQAKQIRMTAAELSLLLNGIDLSSVKRRPRYARAS